MYCIRTFLCSKIALLLLPILEGNHSCTNEIFFFFSTSCRLEIIELSDVERRNRKISAHDCTDLIKTLFSSDNYH